MYKNRRLSGERCVAESNGLQPVARRSGRQSRESQPRPMPHARVAAMVFPMVPIPIYGVPHSFLIHSYSLIGSRASHRNSRTARNRRTTGWMPLAHEHHELFRTNAPSFAERRRCRAGHPPRSSRPAGEDRRQTAGSCSLTEYVTLIPNVSTKGKLNNNMNNRWQVTCAGGAKSYSSMPDEVCADGVVSL